MKIWVFGKWTFVADVRYLFVSRVNMISEKKIEKKYLYNII